MNATISDILHQLMQKAKISEAELARRTGTPQPTLHRILSGATRSPRGESLSKLANYFSQVMGQSITMDQLIGNAPLDLDRMHGGHVSTHTRTWHSVPLLPLTRVLELPTLRENNLFTDNWPNWTTTDIQTSTLTFAIGVDTDSLTPRFPRDTVLIVEPNLPAEDRDFVVIQTENSATVRQLLIDGQDSYLKPLNPEFQTTMMGDDHTIIAVVLQARTDIRRRDLVTETVSD